MAAGWLKSGLEASKDVEKYEKEIKLRQESRGKMFRFWLEKNEEARITFVDGNLTKEGVLDFVSCREHNIFMGGHWGNHFVCIEDIEEMGPCPICETGDTPSLIGCLTIIDHRKIESSKEKGKFYVDTPRLFVATKDTIKLLQAQAVKRGGLSGATFDVLRVGERSARVGTQFEFIEKGDPEVIKKKYTRVVEDQKTKQKKLVISFVPANYETELTLKTADELRMLGFGSSKKIGAEPLVEDSSQESASSAAEHL